MAVDVVWTSYGQPAAQALHRAVAAAKGGDPLAPVTVVVPSNHVGVAARRQLASGALGPVAGTATGLAAVTFVTTYRLAELLGAPSLAAQGKRPVSTPVLAAAMRTELAAEPGLFGPVAAHPATEAALVASYRELRDCSPGALDALAATSARAREVVRLHRATRAHLGAAWSDEEDLLDAAAASVSAAIVADLGAVIVHLPQRLSQHGARLLLALADQLAVTVVAAVTGDDDIDAEVRSSLERLGVALGGAPALPMEVPVAPERTTIVTASDSDEEVRAAVRAIVDAVRGGTRLDRIAVLHASPEPYARLAHEQLQAAGITTNGAAVLPLAARLAGRTLLELLALPEHGFRRQDVFAWLAAAPIHAGGRWAPTTAWERLSREAAVVAGRAQWDTLLTQLAAQQAERAEAYAADDEAPAWKSEQAQRNADQALELRAFVLRLIDDLAAAAAAPKRWSAHAAWAQRHLDDLLGRADRRERWPEVERRAAERVELALQRLGALDAVEGPVALEVFARTLQLELETDLGRVGRFGDGVLVGSVEMGIGLDLDLVVILGLAEGSFPATVRDDSLLPDGERAATGGELGRRADRVDRQHRHLLGALAGARQQLLCLPRGDLRRSVERVPSRWVLGLCEQLAGTDGSPAPTWEPADLTGATVPWVAHVASFDAGLRTMPLPATAQEHRLRALLAAGGALTATGDARTTAGAAVVTARRSAAFTRFDGNLHGLVIQSPVGSVTSPTRLERWASCPHRYLVEDLLRAAPVENPEDTFTITPIDKGNLVHHALERFLLEVLARPGDEQPEPGDPWTDADRARLRAIGEEECERYERLGLTGRPIFWRRERRTILRDLDDALTHDDTRRRGAGTTPVAVELAFGFQGHDGEPSLPPVAIPLPDGRVLEVRGRADRLDVATDGTIHVVDYKTGSTRAYADLTAENPLVGGTKLQLPIYGLAGRLHQGDDAAPVRAEYWFVTSKGDFKRIGFEVTDGILEQTIATLTTIVAGIEAGVFPPHPDREGSTSPFVSCHTCDPDGLGTVDLREQFEHKRLDPVLRRYADLAEPLPDDEEVPA